MTTKQQILVAGGIYTVAAVAALVWTITLIASQAATPRYFLMRGPVTERGTTCAFEVGSRDSAMIFHESGTGCQRMRELTKGGRWRVVLEPEPER